VTVNSPTQYVTDANLRARQRLWESQQPRFDFTGWVLDLAAPRPGDRVLDVGCGNGSYLRALDARGVDAVGTDISVGMLAAAAHDQLVQSDAQFLPFRTASFAVVLAPHMLYHVPDPARAIHELRRVLRPGGTCVVTTNGSAHMRTLRSLVEDVVRVSTPGWELRDPSTRSFTLDNSAALLEGAFDDVTCVRSEQAPVRIVDAALAADYVASVADFYGPEVRCPWDDVVAEVRDRVAAQIALAGEFVVASDAGAFVCR
jgi:SAM-dependent methyltransferase